MRIRRYTRKARIRGWIPRLLFVYRDSCTSRLGEQHILPHLFKVSLTLNHFLVPLHHNPLLAAISAHYVKWPTFALIGALSHIGSVLVNDDAEEATEQAKCTRSKHHVCTLLTKRHAPVQSRSIASTIHFERSTAHAPYHTHFAAV